MGRSSRVAFAVVVAACSSPRPPAPVAARPPPAFTSPGPLTAGHQVAAGCNACHVGETKEISNDKCLGFCHQHDNFRARIAAGKGFHASSVVKGKSCATCHFDHRGPTYDPTGWASIGGRDRFDHDRTGWRLDGAHAAAPCDRCHSTTDAQGIRTYMGTEVLCGGCHQDRVHGFARRAMLACERCHTTSVWKPVRAAPSFNHDDRKDAMFPTFGVHTALPCADCHPNSRFVLGTGAGRCDNCHPTPHAKHVFGARDCTWCHSPAQRTFKTIVFDHTERSRFTLGRAHDQLACTTCHTRALGVALPPTACEACHPKRSPHKNRFDAFACATCHSPAFSSSGTPPGAKPKWPPNRFDHARNTKFKLTGKHAELTCRRCHRGSNPADFERWPDPVGCMDCHAHARVHADADYPNGKYTNADCIKCHGPTW